MRCAAVCGVRLSRVVRCEVEVCSVRCEMRVRREG